VKRAVFVIVLLVAILGFDNSFERFAVRSADAYNSPTVRSHLVISEGTYHSLGLKSDGTVWAWGDNRYGELGIGSYSDTNTPVQVPGLTGIVSVSAGGYHSLALTADGKVWAWGDNRFGQLGNGRSLDNNSVVPVQVSGLTGILAISAGGAHSLALKSDGTVWAWGWNSYGQLGNGSNADSNVPVKLSGLTGVAAVYARGGHSLALTADGKVWAWGWNNHGQLGDGTGMNSNLPLEVWGPTGVVSISAGSSHSLALTSDGKIWAWGGNNFGQLGNGSNADSNVPVQVSGTTVTRSVSAGGFHSLALTSDGTVWAWGYNGNGQLGNGSNANSNVPVQVSGLTEVEFVSGGASNSVAVQSDGTVWAWGSNSYGQFGDGSNADSMVPVKSNFILVSDPRDVKSIGAGDFFSLGLRSAGTVWTWGNNNAWQLGRDCTQTGPCLSPGTVLNNNWPVSPLKGVMSVSGGYTQSLALMSNGSAWGWGDGYISPKLLLSLPKLDSIVGTHGIDKTLALTSTGIVWIGDVLPIVTGNFFTGLTGVVSISVGLQHYIALKSDGTVLAWGQNNYGQLGNGSISYSSAPVQVKTSVGGPPLTGIVAVAAGHTHSLALKSDGTVWAWGNNQSGQLGKGVGGGYNNIAVQVAANGFVVVDAGGDHSLAIRADGTAWAWGSNSYGQLGNGNNATSSVPVQ